MSANFNNPRPSLIINNKQDLQGLSFRRKLRSWHQLYIKQHALYKKKSKFFASFSENLDSTLIRYNVEAVGSRDPAHSSTRPRLIKHERRKTLLVRLVFVLRGTMHNGLRSFLKKHSYFQGPSFYETYLSLPVQSQIKVN